MHASAKFKGRATLLFHTLSGTFSSTLVLSIGALHTRHRMQGCVVQWNVKNVGLDPNRRKLHAPLFPWFPLKGASGTEVARTGHHPRLQTADKDRLLPKDQLCPPFTM